MRHDKLTTHRPSKTRELAADVQRAGFISAKRFERMTDGTVSLLDVAAALRGFLGAAFKNDMIDLDGRLVYANDTDLKNAEDAHELVGVVVKQFGRQFFKAMLWETPKDILLGIKDAGEAVKNLVTPSR
jgi:hypothetical protein